MYPQVSKLQGMNAESEMPGELHWEVGYFGKPQFRPALRTDGKDRNLPDELKDNPALQDEKGVANDASDDAVQHTPPDPLWPSGVCSIIVHQIVNLELENVKGTQGSRKGKEFEPAKPYGEATEEEGNDLPTSYCSILFNDQLVYRTRSKAVSSKPIFEAGTERFVRDWRSTIITVAVRDSRNREHDPILGIVPLKISDILETSSQVTRWYPLDGGIGFGRVRISLLFRSIETRLPPQQLGWDVGTFLFMSDNIDAKGYDHHAKIKLRTGGSIGKISRSSCHKMEAGDGFTWDLAHNRQQSEELNGRKIRLPVKHRYRSPVVFEFHTANKRKADAYAILWLNTLTDNEPIDIDLPIYRTAAPARLTQNYIIPEMVAASQGGEVMPGLEDLKEVGRLTFKGMFNAGMDESHEAFVADNDTRETYEVWEACHAEGVRGPHVEKELPERVATLHDESLLEGRDSLKNAAPEEKQKWLSKTGTDWSGAFGDDPAKYMDSNGRKKAEPGRAPRKHDPNNPSSDEDYDTDNTVDTDDDLGIQDGSNMNGSSPTNTRRSFQSGGTGGTRESGFTTGTTDTYGAPKSQKEIDRANKKTEERKQRGLMQWKPARNLRFAKNQGTLGIRKLKGKITGSMEGREPGIETETGT